MWTASQNFLSTWVTLDENDNDPVRFWTYICSALRTLDPSLSKATLSALNGPQLPSFHALLSSLINDLTVLKKNCVLVLDDYHAITSADINDGLSFLIQHLPQTLHLVILSRNEPSYPLGILRARDELLDINIADLRFAESETQAFLYEVLSVKLPQAMISRLQERTEGRTAGLRLAALSLHNQNPEETEKIIQTFSGNHRYVSDYLIKRSLKASQKRCRISYLRPVFLIG